MQELWPPQALPLQRQWPPLHTNPAGHALVHPPQWSASLETESSQPLAASLSQSAKPTGQYMPMPPLEPPDDELLALDDELDAPELLELDEAPPPPLLELEAPPPPLELDDTEPPAPEDVLVDDAVPPAPVSPLPQAAGRIARVRKREKAIRMAGHCI